MLAAGSSRGTVEMIDYLLSKNADLFAADNLGDTALHYAASTGKLPVVQDLVTSRAPIDVVDNLGRSPLYMAALAGRLEVVKLFIDNKARLETTPSPLSGAVKGANELVIKYLLENGAHL